MAISLISFDRLDFRTLGYPQNGAPFSPPILGVEFRCCLAASRPKSHTRRAGRGAARQPPSHGRGEGLSSEGEPERMRFTGRADSIGGTYQGDSERSSRRKANEAETGGANRLINCRRAPPAKVLATRISMSHLIPLLEFNL